MTGSAYTTDEYWLRNPTFHEEDAAYKAEQCAALLRKADVLGTIRTGIDIGCGSGQFLAEFAQLTEARLLGMDVSPAPIARANELNRNERVTFAVGDARTLTEIYDIAFINDVFEHVDDYIGFLASIRHVARLFYFNVPLDMNILGVLRHRYMYAREKVGHLHYFSEPSALATLEYAGYSIVDSRHNRHVPHDLKTHPSVRKYIAALPRLISYRIAPKWSVHVLGGASLGILARPTA